MIVFGGRRQALTWSIGLRAASSSESVTKGSASSIALAGTARAGRVDDSPADRLRRRLFFRNQAVGRKMGRAGIMPEILIVFLADVFH